VPKKSSCLFLSPATALMNRMTFSKKFALLGLITLVAICITIYSLYNSLNQTISSNRKELEGLALIRPVVKTIQFVQRHRGLSSAELSGVSELRAERKAKEHDVEVAFSNMNARLPANSRLSESWKGCANEWERIQADGLQWPRIENFTSHTNLIDELLLLESVITDDYGLTADPSLDTYYLAIASSNELLNALEHLGQIRAYGTGILGTKKASEQQMVNMSTLITLLNSTLKPLKINMEKAAYYNPGLKQVIAETYANIENTSGQVINVVNEDILNKHFSMQAKEFFAITTKSIDSGYEQLYQSLLPSAEQLIKARIQQTKTELQVSVGFALLLLLLLAYFMVAIYYATLGNIKILTNSVLGFRHGDMCDRVHLETRDELTQIGDGFNIMADELTELITERQAALDLLMKIADSVPGVVYQYRQRADGSACFPFASEAICEIYRVTPEQVCNDASKVFASIYPADLDELVASIRTSAQELTLWHHEYRVKFDDGTVKWLLGNAMPEHEADGSTLWHGFITDISVRKAAEAKLRMLSTAIEQSPASVAITNLDAEIEYVNPHFTEVTGFSLAEAVGQNPRILQSKLTEKSVFQSMWDKLTNGQPWIGEFINKRKNGEIYFEEAYISPVKDVDGSVTHYVAVKLDVTERKRMEYELTRSNAELEQFAYAVSHDMRQPLRMVSSYLSLIENALAGSLNEETRQFLDFAIDGAKRMDAMILSLLDYSRIGRKSEAKARISSKASLDEALAFLNPELNACNGEIKVTGDWPELFASRDELTRLLQNLIGNALKYHEENKPPQVHVHGTAAESSLRVEVRDNGIGIEPSQTDRLFKVFSRLQARSRFDGTGVGLALCRKIVEHHGGTIGVESAGEGRGCMFWFELPLETNISL
jgi:PAS domain S-box-containing protein